MAQPYGCYICSFFVGALAYADDLVLLAPTPSAMRQLLRICDEYADEFSIKFNAKKSKWLAYYLLWSGAGPKIE